MARFFIDRPIFAWVIAIIIMLAGGLALFKLPISMYPNVAPPAVEISASYPGASAKVVEDGLKPGDKVIVEGLQKIQPGMPVQATEMGAAPAKPATPAAAADKQ